MLLFNPLVEFTDIVMMRKCLLGIKRRAEAAATPTVCDHAAAVTAS